VCERAFAAARVLSISSSTSDNSLFGTVIVVCVDWSSISIVSMMDVLVKVSRRGYVIDVYNSMQFACVCAFRFRLARVEKQAAEETGGGKRRNEKL